MSAVNFSVLSNFNNKRQPAFPPPIELQNLPIESHQNQENRQNRYKKTLDRYDLPNLKTLKTNFILFKSK